MTPYNNISAQRATRENFADVAARRFDAREDVVVRVNFVDAIQLRHDLVGQDASSRHLDLIDQAESADAVPDVGLAGRHFLARGKSAQVAIDDLDGADRKGFDQRRDFDKFRRFEVAVEHLDLFDGPPTRENAGMQMIQFRDARRSSDRDRIDVSGPRENLRRFNDVARGDPIDAPAGENAAMHAQLIADEDIADVRSRKDIAILRFRADRQVLAHDQAAPAGRSSREHR